MASTAAHAASCSLIALIFANVNPEERKYIYVAIISASIIDVDHLIYINKNYEIFQKTSLAGNLHKARSIFHEMFGIFVAGLLAIPLYFYDHRLSLVFFLAFTLHIVQDWILGKSTPFSPVDKTLVMFFSLSQNQKVVIDIFIILSSGILWMIYLKGML